MPGIRESIELACTLEVLARKPGNVHPGQEFEDLSVADLILSGLAIAPVLAEARTLRVGQAILNAVRASRRVSRTNANLGIVLLLAPLSSADSERGPSPDSIATVLETLSVEDARLAYQAIREASPGGLGHVENQDVAAEPTVTLLEAMRLASDRDTIALQYVSGFRDLFDLGVTSLLAAIDAGCGMEEAIVWCHLHWMAVHADSLVARKCGVESARESTLIAANVIAKSRTRPGEIGTAGPKPGFLETAIVRDFDAWLRADGNRRNPGTSADLVAASLYIALRCGRLDPRTTPWRTP